MPVDPNALATWANAVTVSRILVSPLMFTAIPSAVDGRWVGSWWAVALWFVLCVSDSLDGYLARRHGTTRSGAFLDPLADKVLVLGALFSLVAIDRFGWLPVTVIAVREVAVSLWRVHLGRKGLAVPARASAKAKTFAQAIAVGCALAPALSGALWVADVILWVSVALTVVSAVQYAADGHRAATSMTRDRDRP